MLAVDRRHLILERVAEQQTIHIAELARELGVSEMTIRRDIARLERDGFLRRTYGGATAHVTRSMELGFNARALQQAAAKRLIGMRAAQLVEEVTTLFIGIGTTTEQFALFLPTRDDRTIITNSVPLASLLGTRSGRVVILGGTVRRDELSCIGPVAAATVRRYHAELAVLGAAGVSATGGLTEFFDEEAEIHRLMIERSDRLIVLADGSKFGVATMAAVAPATAIDLLITDDSAPPHEVSRLGALGVEIATVERSTEGRRLGRQAAGEAGVASGRR
jgi:DeoR/GlpR family transcriptional regulator of sugar metabolism